MNELKIKLNQELMEKIKKGKLKTIEMISFILDTVPDATSTKERKETALKDIDFNGKYPLNARVDMDQETLTVIFSENIKENIEINSTLKSNTKFTDGIREYEIIEYVDQFKMYKLKNYTDNRENELMTEAQIKSYIEKKEYYEKRLIKGKQKAIEYKLQEEKEKAEAERKEKEYKFCYGFVNNKMKLQQGKILKILNKQMLYNGQWYTAKDFIEYIVKIHPTIVTKKYFNTNRISKKKIEGCYKKLVDKMEYSAWWLEEGQKAGVDLTKTEYDYCNYLISNKIKIA